MRTEPMRDEHCAKALVATAWTEAIKSLDIILQNESGEGWTNLYRYVT